MPAVTCSSHRFAAANDVFGRRFFGRQAAADQQLRRVADVVVGIDAAHPIVAADAAFSDHSQVAGSSQRCAPEPPVTVSSLRGS
jgi:hypothetical protein